MRSTETSGTFPWIFVLTALVGLVPFRVPIRGQIVLGTSLVMVAVALWAPRARYVVQYPLYLSIELVGISIIVWASDGIHGPLAALYLVPILQCSVRYGSPWGLFSAVVCSVALTVGELFLQHARPVWEIDRLAIAYPFYLLVGYVTSALSEARAREIEARMEATARLAAEQRAQANEMRLAEEIQRELMPKNVSAPKGWQVEWRLQMHRAVGGDLVQFLPIPKGLGCVVADVTGKGVSAAMLVGSLHAMLTRLGHLCPHEVLHEVNATMCRDTPSGISVSMVILHLDAGTGEVRLANAGHPYPLVWRAATGELEEWSVADVMAGWFEDSKYHTQRRMLARGDTLLIYTDGLSDAFREGRERWDDNGVRELFSSVHDEPLSVVADKLLECASSDRQSDDVTVLLVRRDLATIDLEGRVEPVL